MSKKKLTETKKIIITLSISIVLLVALFFLINSTQVGKVYFNEMSRASVVSEKVVTISCPSGFSPTGIKGKHNSKLVTQFGLQCGEKESNLAGKGGRNHQSFGPDKCSTALTGLNLYPKTGPVTRITKICDGAGQDYSNAKVLECATGIKSFTVELNKRGFIYDVKKVNCNANLAGIINTEKVISVQKAYTSGDALVYKLSKKISKTLEIIQLKNLKKDGTLPGEAVKVINYCSNSGKYYGISIDFPLKSPNNIFVYDPVKEKIKFDQVNAVYYGIETISFFIKFADLIGWETPAANGKKKLEIPILKIELCHPDLGPTEDGKWQGGSFNWKSEAMMFSCYSKLTCASIGKSVTNVPEDEGLKLGTFIHEYTHGLYVKTIKPNGVNYENGEWLHLNEAYASFIPRMHITTSSIGEYGDLNNNFQYGKENTDCPLECAVKVGDENKKCMNRCISNHPINTIAGALWDVGQKINNNDLMVELVITSWKNLQYYKTNSASVASMIALIEASKQKYGINSQTHKNNRKIIITTFKNHGIECQNCFSGS